MSASSASASSAHADALAPFLEEAAGMLPAGASLFDAHTHLGLDEDGRSLDLPSLLAQLDDAGVRRAAVFPLHDPERRPAYTLPNDRVLAWAGESEDRLIPFCRLDPFDNPIAEGRRCIEAGARGIKLHPRAQSFTFHGDGLASALDGIFGLAEEAGAPILIHAGRGLPPIAAGLAELAMRHPDVVLILAHGAICDQGTLTSGLADHPGILYDTSCFHPIDVLALFARVPAERIVFGSDPPYGRPASGLYLALRAAQAEGLDDQALRAVLGESMGSLFDGTGLADRTPPRGGAAIVLSPRLARLYGYTSMAGPALFTGALDRAREALDLALGVCRDPDPGQDGEALEVIGKALAAAISLLQSYDGEPEGRRSAAIELIHRCMVRAATEWSSSAQATEPSTLHATGAPAHAG
jgi:predicted TIM-barrel fold metal-dependent hydrolase